MKILKAIGIMAVIAGLLLTGCTQSMQPETEANIVNQ